MGSHIDILNRLLSNKVVAIARLDPATEILPASLLAGRAFLRTERPALREGKASSHYVAR